MTIWEEHSRGAASAKVLRHKYGMFGEWCGYRGMQVTRRWEAWRCDPYGELMLFLALQPY